MVEPMTQQTLDRLPRSTTDAMSTSQPYLNLPTNQARLGDLWNASVASPTFRYAVRRTWQAAILIAITVLLTFILINLAPGDMVDVMAGEAGAADAGYLELLRGRYGLDQPLPLRFFHYLVQIGHFDLGFSFRHNLPVRDLILSRLGATASLIGIAITLAVLGAVALGTIAARHVNGAPDRIISVVTLLSYAVPTFWLGLMLVLLFSVKLRWLPSSGSETLFSGYTGWARLRDQAEHLVLPVLTLALFHLALYTRLLRASLLEVLNQDFIRTARAKGLTERRVIAVHALGNSLLPLVTMVGMQIGATIGGVVVIESVFAWPGLGRLAMDAVLQRDTTLLVGIVLFSGCFVAIVNLLVDLFYSWLDPRIVRN